MTYLVAVGISAAVGYFVVVGAVWQLFDWLDEARSISSLFWPKQVGSQTWDAERDAIRAAVSHLGNKEVAYELDISGSALSDAINERDRKRWAAEWSHVVIAMLHSRAAAGDDIAADCLRSLVFARIGIAPFDAIEQQPLDDKQLAAAALAELAKYGEAGKASIARLKRGAR